MEELRKLDVLIASGIFTLLYNLLFISFQRGDSLVKEPVVPDFSANSYLGTDVESREKFPINDVVRCGNVKMVTLIALSMATTELQA